MRVGDSIYLDYQATTPIDPRVLSAMEPLLDLNFGNPHSADHAIGWSAAKAVEQAANEVAKLIGADSDEVIFTSGATESNNLALLGFARRAFDGKRKRILVGAVEHKCVLAASRAIADQLGFKIERLPVDGDGIIKIDYLNSIISDDVLLISVMAVNNEIGTIEPIEKISAIARNNGVILHCDAAQAPCAIDVSNMSQLVDMLSLSGHKIYGPKGIGVLYIRRELQDRIEPLIYGGGQQRNLRSGTVPAFLAAGMGAAASLISGSNAVNERMALCKRVHTFISGLLEAGVSVKLNGPRLENRHPGNANLRFEGFDAQDILGALQPGLAASTGSACTSGIPEPSHVLMAIGLTNEEAASSIRFSFGRFIEDKDVETAISRIVEALQKLSAKEVNLVARSQ